MDYEKKYKEALEWARKVMQGKVGFVLDEVLEKFPELKESEDEITKRMLDIITYKMSQHQPDIFTGEENEWLNDWLEKQDKKDEKILILKDQIESLHAAIKAVKETHRIELEKQGEQNHALKPSKDEDVRKFMQYIEKQAKSYDINLPNRSYDIYAFSKDILAWLEKQGNLMKALQISNARIGELIEENYYLKEQLEKQGKNNMGISEDTKQKLEDNLNKALEKETPESWNEFLEKQGGQKSKFRVGDTIKCKYDDRQFTIKSVDLDKGTYTYTQEGCGNDIDYADGEFELVEQNPTDKVEPKFREGDWVVSPNGLYWHIDAIQDGRYQVSSDSGKSADWPLDTNIYHKFTIEDARDGDVLVSESTCGLGTWYCIFKSLDGDESMTVYCYLARDGRFETKKELCFDKDPYNTKPATKEQRDQLEKAMANAGYKWDADKKELKKIEQKPIIEMITPEESLGIDSDTYNKIVDECVYGEQNPAAWSEKDIELLDNTIKFIEDRVAATSPSLRTYSPTLTGKEIPFLKSLKDRYTWKPSDEQMDALRYVTNFDYGGYKATLVSLYEQLNKLKQ